MGQEEGIYFAPSYMLVSMQVFSSQPSAKRGNNRESQKLDDQKGCHYK
jgi:hypothetical protein